MPPLTPPALVATCIAGAVADQRQWSLRRGGPAEAPAWELHVCRHVASALLMALSPAGVTAQGQPSTEAAQEPRGTQDKEPTERPRENEWHVGAGYGWSIDLLQSEGGRRYVPVTVAWGRDLTVDAGPGMLRGRLMWAVEVMPLYWQHRPTSTVGLAVSPLVWRWRFTPGRVAAPFAELAFGGLFTGDPVPEGTEAANFVTHGAFGIRWQPSRRASWVTAYRFQHISNGNQFTTNPGVNAHVLWFGLSLRP